MVNIKASNIMIFICLILVYSYTGYTKSNDIQLADAKFMWHKKKIVARVKKPWSEYHGVVNKTPVYLLMQNSKDDLLVGYLYDNKGNNVYVYGKKVNNQLQVFDTEKNKYTIVLFDQKK